MTDIKKIKLKSTPKVLSKADKRRIKEQYGTLEPSPFLIIVYCLGLVGIIGIINNALHMDTGNYIMLTSFSVVFSTVLWALYFFRRRIFIIFSIVFCFVACIIIIPKAFTVASEYSEGVFFGVDAVTIITVIALLLYFIFSLEFVLRNHSLMFLIILAALILCPVLGISTDAFSVVPVLLFMTGFVTVNMVLPQTGRTTLKMKGLSKASAASMLCTAVLILAAVAPSLLIENRFESSLFEGVNGFDAFVRDTAAAITGNGSGTVEGGKVSRGNLLQNGKTMIAVNCSQKPKENMYLYGFRGLEYTPNGWENAFGVGNRGDFHERLSNMNIGEYIAEYIGRPNSNDPLPELYYTYTLWDTEMDTEWFFSSKSYEEYYAEKEQEEQSKSNSISNWMNILRFDSTEDTPYYLPYYSNTSPAELTYYSNYIGSSGYSTEYIDAENIDIGDVLANDKIYDSGSLSGMLDSYMSDISVTYTQYPTQDTERLRELCSETELSDLNEITTFILYSLQTHAVYSKTPGTTPFNKDPIDYFMFDNGRGYCVHFASAATLMYRMYGIPARYVSGFCISPDNFSKGIDGGYYADVLDYSAHAWVEIFLRDYGWVPVEVTPTVEGVMRASYPGYDETEMNRIMKEHGWQFRRTGSDGSTHTRITTDGSVDYSQVILIIIAVLFVGVAVAALIIRRRILLNLLHEGDCKYIFTKYIKLIHFCGILKSLYGSEEDFSKRLCKECECLSYDETKKLIDIMLRVSFSEDTQTDDDRRYIKMIYFKTAHSEYKKLNIIKRLMYKLFYVFGK